MSEVTRDIHQTEGKWQRYWEETGLFRCRTVGDARPKYYCLTMYPYPSGALHMGHVIVYTLGDVFTRYQMRRGRNVLSPMGWDSFGLPAENAAIKSGVHPEDSTRANIDKMRSQMLRAGWGYDWSREIAVSHPDYYRWTQWLFLKFYERGLAFKKLAPVNWCPQDQTVLANEQVIDGCCERCGTPVEPRDMVQWFFRMSAYAQRLLDDHAKLRGHWPERVLRMQEEWIGRSEGARLDFTVEATGEPLTVFTTRPDTTFGVTFMAIAPEHPLVARLVQGTAQEKPVLAAAARMRRQSAVERTSEESEKEGIFTGQYLLNPFDGSRVPLWVTNYAVMEYGTGAVMAVPAHDQRDFLFARKYGLPVKVVIQPAGESLDPAAMTQAYVEPGVQVNSARFDGLPNEEAKRAMTEYAKERGFGDFTVNYRLRDWLLSRQRYWGAPIPIIYCDACGELPLPEEQLPVLLPRDVDFQPGGESPLARSEGFVRTTCPRCGKPARRETDTMDTFVDSSWYFLRYLSPREEGKAFDTELCNAWLPVDRYVGGIEHATMHLIYARFFSKVLADLGLLGFDEPFANMFTNGMVCKTAYRCPRCLWLPEAQVDLATMTCRTCGTAVVSEMAKMSKTKLNVVSPDELFDRFGADAVHLYALFMGPADRDMVYSDQGLVGIDRFLNRLSETVMREAARVRDVASYGGGQAPLSPETRALRHLVHRTVRKVTDELEGAWHFNTSTAQVMELLAGLREWLEDGHPQDEREREVLREALELMVSVLSPFAPHLAEELYEQLGGRPSIFQQPWPEADPEALAAEELEIPVQVDGRLRARLMVSAETSEEELREQALSDPRVARHLVERTVVRVVVVPRRLVNIVSRPGSQPG
jgi:leucyl-tRNA synthetase